MTLILVGDGWTIRHLSSYSSRVSPGPASVVTAAPSTVEAASGVTDINAVEVPCATSIPQPDLGAVHARHDTVVLSMNLAPQRPGAS